MSTGNWHAPGRLVEMAEWNPGRQIGALYHWATTEFEFFLFYWWVKNKQKLIFYPMFRSLLWKPWSKETLTPSKSQKTALLCLVCKLLIIIIIKNKFYEIPAFLWSSLSSEFPKELFLSSCNRHMFLSFSCHPVTGTYFHPFLVIL